MQLIDLNGDGKADAQYVSLGSIPQQPGYSEIGIRCGNTTGGFGSETAELINQKQPAQLRMADVDNNGIKDYVMTEEVAGDIVVYTGADSCTSYGTGQLHSYIGINTQTLGLGVGDVDGDSKPDVVVLTDGQLWIATGNNYGFFNTASSTTIADNSLALALVDIDGDGDLDAVVTYEDEDNDVGKVAVYPNNGSGTWGTATTYTVDSLPVDVAVADMNEDATLDIVTISRVKGTVTTILR